MASSSEEHVKHPEGQPPFALSAGTDEPSPPLSQPSWENRDHGSTSERALPHNHAFQNTQAPWMFGFSGMGWNPVHVGGNSTPANGSSPLVPIFSPVPLAGYQGQLDEQRLRSGGIFAVPIVPVVGPFPGFPPTGLIPVSYNIPQNMPITRNTSSTASSEPMDRAIPAQAQEPAAVGPLQAGGLNIPPPVAVPPGHQPLPDGQRQIVRRFHVAFQIDLLLILKLAVVVFIFNQDGSRDRLFLLLFLAGLAYLYQTGALSPLLHWISQSAQRAMMPPQQQQPPAQAAPADRGAGQGGMAAADAPAPVGVEGGGAENEAAAPIGDAGALANVGGDRAQQQAPPAQGATWWGFLKEVQMLVVGFVTSLLPGFHQHMD